MTVKKPLLKEGNWEKRLRCVNYTSTGLKISGKVLWSDESKFNILEVRREVQQSLQPSVKHSEGSVIVLGLISASGVGDLFKPDGIMNAEK